MQNGIKISHQDKGNVYGSANVGELFEKRSHAHTIFKRLCRSRLNSGAISQRVAKGHANFYHVDATLLQGLKHGYCAIERRISCAKVNRENILFFSIEKLFYTVHRQKV